MLTYGISFLILLILDHTYVHTLQLPQLNPSQRRAIMLALNQSLTLIQGPPGTGMLEECLLFACVSCNSLIYDLIFEFSRKPKSLIRR